MSGLDSFNEDFNYKRGVLLGNREQFSPDAKDGLIILTGQIMDDDPYLSMGEIRNSIKQLTSTNVLYISLHNTHQTLDDVSAIIKDFASKNEKITMVSAMHGFEVTPFSSHHMRWGVQEGHGTLSDIKHYLADGKYIASSDILQMFSTAIGKPFDLWQASCQGSKTIASAQETLPKGSVMITETAGYNSNPSVILKALEKTLEIAAKSHSAISLDDILSNYLKIQAMSDNKYFNFEPTTLADILSHYLKTQVMGDNKNFNLEPTKTIIGGESKKLTHLADSLMSDLANSKVSNATKDKLVNEFCKLDNSAYCQNYVYDLMKYMGNSYADGKTISACTTDHGNRNWLWEQAKCESIGWDCYDTGYFLWPWSGCAVNEGAYLATQGLGYLYDSIAE
jgi:hypothetical protein